MYVCMYVCKDRVILVQETETIIKKVPLLVRSPKQVIILNFIPLTFFVLYFPASISDFFPSLLPFLILEI